MSQKIINCLLLFILFSLTGCIKKEVSNNLSNSPTPPAQSTSSQQKNLGVDNKITATKLYRNNKYGLEFSFPDQKITIDEIDSKDGLLSVNFMASKKGENNVDRNLYSGLRIYHDIPNTAFGQNSLDESLKSAPKGMYSDFIGFSSDYKWKCGDGHNVGGNKTRDCQIQRDKNVFVLDYNYEFSKLFSRSEFDAIVKSFKFIN